MFIKPHSYSDDYSNRSFPLSKKCKYLSNHLPLILGYSTTLASSGNSFSIFHSTHTSLYISNSSRHWGNTTEQCTLKSLPCGCHSGGERNNTANSSVQSLSRVRLCNPMNRSTPGLPVHHQLPEFMQTHAHGVGDTIQPPHPLSSPFPPAPIPSQHQGLFQ